MSPMPSYRLHRASMQAIVTLTDARTGRRKDVYLGDYDSPESRERYHRTIAEWLGRGRRLIGDVRTEWVSVADLVDAYLDHAEFARMDPAHLAAARVMLGLVKAMHGSTPAREFGPKALRGVRAAALRGDAGRGGWSRTYTNRQVRRVVTAWRWAVSHEMIEPDTLAALETVEPLRKGRTDAPETTPVGPAPAAHITAVLDHVPAPVAAMIRFQMLTGARPGEVCVARPCDMDRGHPSGVWIYRPSRHKKGHLDQAKHGRVIGVGPQAQAVIAPFMLRPPAAYLFSPRESWAAMFTERRERRVTPLREHEGPTDPRTQRLDRLRDHYVTSTYRQAIHRGCERAGVPVWNPHQIRHTRADELERAYGMVQASKALGHSRADITARVYTSTDIDTIVRLAREVG